jgi:hypothetical protein
MFIHDASPILLSTSRRGKNILPQQSITRQMKHLSARIGLADEVNFTTLYSRLFEPR